MVAGISNIRKTLMGSGFAVIACVALAMPVVTAVGPAWAADGEVITTPFAPMELPMEIEVETGPASLKQAPLWKEHFQVLEEGSEGVVACPPGHVGPTGYCANIARRPGFGATMPPLNAWPLDYNFLTAEPLRLRTSDGEVSWDQPGPLFEPDEIIATDGFNTPLEEREAIGHLVACPNGDPAVLGDPNEYSYIDPLVLDAFCVGKPAGSLVVYNPAVPGDPMTPSTEIPEHGTVVAVPAVQAGVLQELDGVSTTVTEDVLELEIPVNEEDFFRPTTDVVGIPNNVLRTYIGRPAAEVLGKALFWDMQVGSDAVQACGSCHFHGGADNRTRNQLNPNSLGGDGELDVVASGTTNVDVDATLFPFHKRFDPLAGGDGIENPEVVERDANDVMSSMGVSRFKRFADIPPIGLATSFVPNLPNTVDFGVRSLRPDIACGDAGTDCPAEDDPIAVMQGVRRIEPRNTPTFHGAAFNFDNFWDSRARFVFNGGSVFGASDPQAHIFINLSPTLAPNAGPLVPFQGATNGDIREELAEECAEGEEEACELAEQPVRIKFSSLASQSVGPPLSDFEMSFAGRNWPKIGKKMLQGHGGAIHAIGPSPQTAGTRANAVVPLANQLVDTTDSRLGPFSNRGGSVCTALGRPTNINKPGLCISYPDLIKLAFARQFWNRQNRHLNGAAAVCTGVEDGFPVPAGCDPFDGYALSVANGAASTTNTNQFTHMEANFSVFFGLAVQAYENLTIPDHTPFDQFMDANPFAAHGVGQSGEQAVLFPTLVPDGMDGVFDGVSPVGTHGALNLIPDDPSTDEYDGFGPEELFGMDIFMGANLTAALPPDQALADFNNTVPRNPTFMVTTATDAPATIAVGSNPFARTARCMLCHLGPEQTDHSINIAHGIIKGDAEFEFPTPPFVPDPLASTVPGGLFGDGLLPAPEPSSPIATVPGLILSEEVTEGAAQDAVEVEPRNFATFDDLDTFWDDRVVAQQSRFSFGDQGIYNIGLRPVGEDIGRGGADPFGWPLSLSDLTLKNIGGPTFLPGTTMLDFDPVNLDTTFEETGDGIPFAGSVYELESINPGFERDPMEPQLPEYMVPWMHGLPAGELHPQIDEMAGFAPNTLTMPNGGPAIEYAEVLFGSDVHCAVYNPDAFGDGPPNFGWGSSLSLDSQVCPNNQSGVASNLDYPVHGTWPNPNQVLKDGAFKAPALRNVELTGPYFHTGSYLTLRQVVDFYMRGGDFPLTNAADRDPHIIDIEEQAFAFGPSTDPDFFVVFDCIAGPPDIPAVPETPDACGSFNFLAGTFADALPDTAYLYDSMPDTDHPLTPEYATQEDAKNAIVKFLIALTDPRVKRERAPFDRPEIFVPIDGAAPDNTGGRSTLVTQSGAPCPVPGPGSAGDCFQQVPPVGAAGRPDALPNFLDVSSTPDAGPDHFDSVTDP
jgi:hypothetical protein